MKAFLHQEMGTMTPQSYISLITFMFICIQKVPLVSQNLDLCLDWTLWMVNDRSDAPGTD